MKPTHLGERDDVAHLGRLDGTAIRGVAIQRTMGPRSVDVQDPASVMRHDQEDVEHAERGRGDKKKSMATISPRWFSRNERQFWDGCPGRGGRYRRMVESLTSIPSLCSSAWMRGAPHVGFELHMRILPRRAWGRDHLVDAHRLDALREAAAEDAVAVVFS